MRDDICSFAGCRKPAAVIYLLGGKLRPLCDEHFQHVNAVLERVLGPTGGENDQYTGLAGRGGILSMLA